MDIEAPLKFLADAEVAPVFHASVGGGPVTRYEGQFEDRTVTLQSARDHDPPFTLDLQGFQLVESPTVVTNFHDPEQIRAVYEPEVEALLIRETGARRIVVFDHTLRADSESKRQKMKVREPASFVHNDYTARSAARRVRDFLPSDEADALLEGRFAVINVWRSTAGTVETAPLALCDARSVTEADLVISERRAKDRVGEVQQALYSPHQRWYWYPRVTAGEAILIKTFESDPGAGFCSTLHTSFADPTAPANARPRQSIETRTFAFF